MVVQIQLCREVWLTFQFAISLRIITEEFQSRMWFSIDNTAQGFLIVFIQNVRFCGYYIRLHRNGYMLQQGHVEEMLRRLWHFDGRMEDNSKSCNAFTAQVVGVFLL